MFTDTHCHIYGEYYDSIQKVISDSKLENINRFINSGCDYKSNVEVLKLSKKYKELFCAIGIHPEYAESYKLEDLEYIKNNLKHNKVVAIGEIGLDYHYNKNNKDKQIKLFEYQLQLAQDNNLPVIIHNREATDDMLKILKKYKLKGVIHCFSGSYETAIEYIKLGYLIGINGVITFKNSHLKDVIKKIDKANIVLETDSPYLTPEPLRGRKNSPKNINLIAEYVSELYQISKEELSKITNENIKRTFDF